MATSLSARKGVNFPPEWGEGRGGGGSISFHRRRTRRCGTGEKKDPKPWWKRGKVPFRGKKLAFGTEKEKLAAA